MSPTSPITRRLTPALTLAIAMIVLLAALLGPAQTLAQTRKLGCAGATHARAKHASHACLVRPSNKRKARRAAGRHGRHSLSNSGAGTTIALVPATCEDGSTPVQASGGSYSCGDGSAPECEDGSTPMRSAKGTSLLCAVPIEAAPEAGGECEEELEDACAGEPLTGANEQTCTTSSSTGTSFVCEAEN